LLENGGDPNVVFNGDPAIVYASGGEAFDIVQTLIKHGADVRSKNERGYTALHEAASFSDCKIVQLLLDTGMEPDLRTEDGNTLLSLAAFRNHTGVIDMLFPLGCNVNNEDEQNESPLHMAAKNGNLEMVVKLVNAGANPDCRNIVNMSPLWSAVYEYADRNSVEIVKYLLVKNVEMEVTSCGIEPGFSDEVYDDPRSLLYVAADWSSMDFAGIF
jgi:ankyrin repeat protein